MRPWRVEPWQFVYEYHLPATVVEFYQQFFKHIHCLNPRLRCMVGIAVVHLK